MTALSALKQQLAKLTEEAEDITAELDDAFKKLPTQKKAVGAFEQKLKDEKRSEQQVTQLGK
jgi:hypothetical protein